MKAPYGTWNSPVTSDVVVATNPAFDDVLVDPVTKIIYHLEKRAADHGRCVILDTKANRDVLPSPYSARTFVQEYGGAPAIVYNNIIYFSNESGDLSNPDNGIYALKVGEKAAKPVTPTNPWMRYANFALHPKQTNLLVTLREDHTNDKDREHPHPENVVNTICVVDTTTATVNVIIRGADFYATPVLNPAGDKIAWQQWNLPDMPWQGSLIYVADVAFGSGSLKLASQPVWVAGEAAKKSATFPSWITDTTLVYITDGYNRYQNPYMFHTNTRRSTAVLKTPLEQDFAEPAWCLGLYPYAVLGGGTYGVFTAFKDGGNILYIIGLATLSVPVAIENFDFTVARHVRSASKHTFVFTGSKTMSPCSVALGTVSVGSGSWTVKFDLLKRNADPSKLEGLISKPRPMKLTASAGHPIYVVYYAPFNPYYTGSSEGDEKPPCIVGVHGGPTGLESQALRCIKVFYTTRGYAWLDVNYRGSSGYGRDYIDVLNGNWGIYDVEDCKEAATILATKKNLIDGKRVAIRGGSAGAYTTLCSVTFAPDPTFYKSACGAYGCVADVESLTRATAKFEMRYIYTLLGCPPTSGAWDTRNPIKRVGNIRVPLLLLQGLADGVVPPQIVRDFLSQSTQVGPSGEFVFYPNEGHQWHLASTIRDALAREFHWYQKTLLS